MLTKRISRRRNPRSFLIFMLKTALGNFYLENFSSNRLERIWKLAQVDFKKRYYNDKIGVVWALINPMTQIAIYYFVMVRIFQRGGENFELFIFCGLIIWMAFSQASSLGMRLLITKRYLIQNIQFKWIDLYYSHMISMIMGLSFNLIAYTIFLCFRGLPLGKYWYFFPVVLLSWFLISLATAIILSLLRPVFDDIVHIWNIALTMGFWTSGVFFPVDEYFEKYAWFAHANPFVGLILNTRACLLVNKEIHIGLLFENLIFGLIFFIIALFLFNKYALRVTEKI